MKKLKSKDFLVTASVCLVLLVLIFTGIYKCPLRVVTGIPCPCCGFTRAIVSALCGDFAASFYYHPLWPLMVLGLLAYALEWLGLYTLPKKVRDAAIILLAAAILVCFIIRHILHSPVVEMDFSASLIYRILKSLSLKF